MFDAQQSVMVFPGQGAQKVGMAAEFYALPETRPLFDKADETLGFGLTKLMLEGPQEELTLTRHTQPALFLSGYAAFDYLKQKNGLSIEQMAAYVAGHSLGEYVALAAAGVFGFEEGLKLVHQRGMHMEEAVAPGEGSMAVILTDLPMVQVETWMRGDCWIANDNSAGQIVISGKQEDVDETSNLAISEEVKKIMRLDVSAPFHCPLMAPAAEKMAQTLADIDFNEAQIPVVQNVNAQPETNAARIKENLVAQIPGRVRWRETLEWLAEQGITQQYELGTGTVLSGLARKTDERLQTTALNTPQQIDTLLESLQMEKSA